ncbi:MAG: hypothetical protein HKN33_01050 [Pyrinomonadaceae bacterium]|nr:hypothetical protein [Pyrinomonadaceae bacterium]
MFRRTLLISTCLLVLLSAISGQDKPNSNPGPGAKTPLSKPPALKQTKKKTTTTKLKQAKKSTSTRKKGPSKSNKKKGSDSSSSKKSKSKTAASKSKSKKDKTERVSKEKPVQTDKKSKPLKSESENAAKTEKQAESPPKSETAKKPLLNDSIPFMKTNKAVPAKPASAAGSIWLKTIGSVLLILGLLFVGTWVIKKTGLAGLASGQSGDSPDLKILTSVTPRNGQTISAVRFGDRVLLVGSTQNSFTLLAEDGHDLQEEEAIEESEKEFEFEGRPVSVSELLSRENANFDDALIKAEKSQLLGLGRLS